MSMIWARVSDNTVQEVIRHPKEVLIGGLKYPKTIFSLWTESELNAIGIYIVERAANIDTTYYHRTNQTFAYNSGEDKVEESFTDTAKPVDMAKGIKKGKLKALFASKFKEGFMYLSDPFDIDTVAQANINSEYNAALDTTNVPDPWPSDYEWRDYQNNYVPMTRQEVVDFAVAAREHVRSLYEMKWEHEATIDALEDFQDVVDYDITTGWPQTAEESI